MVLTGTKAHRYRCLIYVNMQISQCSIKTLFISCVLPKRFLFALDYIALHIIKWINESNCEIFYFYFIYLKLQDT